MLRVVIETCDAGMAVHFGGSVERTVKTFDIDVPVLEAFLREKLGTYEHRNVVGVEVINGPLG